MGRGSALRRTLTLSAAFFGLCVQVHGSGVFDGHVPTACGTYQGKSLKQAPGVWAFKGIRYAAPPVDHLRWKPPQSANCTPQSEILAVHNGQACTQKNPIVNITGIKNPSKALRVLGICLLMLSSLISCYIYCSWQKRCCSSVMALEGGSFQEKLLEDTVADMEATRTKAANQLVWHWCRCAAALLSFCAGVSILYFSWEHRIYLRSVLGGEDCLFMNIYAHESALSPSAKPLPVLFFIHGGDLTLGAGTDSGPASLYGGSWALAAEGKAIAVQINYRLNVFGFLYLEDMHGESVLGNSTNLGLLDQLAALRWVQDHIGEFGGDRNSVTIYGQSSGGTSIAALLASPLAKGLFHRSLAMSASPRIDATPSQAALAWRRYFLPALPECINDWDSQDLRPCLYNVPADKLIEAMPEQFSDPDWMSQLPVAKSAGPVIYMVVADGRVVLGNVSRVLAQTHPELPGVPTIFGSVREENDIDLKQVRASTVFDNAAWPFSQQQVVQWGVAIAGDMAFGEKVWHFYKPDASAADTGDDVQSPTRKRWSQLCSDMRSVCGNIYNSMQVARGKDLYSVPPAGGEPSPVYNYLFTHQPQSPVFSHLNGWPSWMESDSSQYAFHMWDTILLFNKTAGFDHQDGQYDTYVFTPLDFAVADRFRSAVLEFAKTGKIASWTPMTPGNQFVCDIASESTTCDSNLKKHECELINAYGVGYGNWNVN